MFSLSSSKCFIIEFEQNLEKKICGYVYHLYLLFLLPIENHLLYLKIIKQWLLLLRVAGWIMQGWRLGSIFMNL